MLPFASVNLILLLLASSVNGYGAYFYEGMVSKF